MVGEKKAGRSSITVKKVKMLHSEDGAQEHGKKRDNHLAGFTGKVTFLYHLFT